MSRWAGPSIHIGGSRSLPPAMSVSALAAFRARRAWRAAGSRFAGECLGAGAADREAAGTGHGTSQEPGKREPLVVGEHGLDGGNGSRQVVAGLADGLT
jgi:hypothetical protein